ncbi:hypothetical protein COLO4_01237 [Corchorus olitorius]|uniref:Uncharacterized protein n=1 Tax=Corchorus olitorius TaxID=93759 RepID=A0A1R3L2S8_9ROSI|nr:hypothetical protein COLO4_01237 [Corchorus olitorius]
MGLDCGLVAFFAAWDFTCGFEGFDDDVDFFFQFLHHIGFRYFADHFAISEQQTFATCAGDADVGFFGFTWSVYCTTKYGYFDRHFQFRDIFFDFIRNGEQIDIKTTAGRAGYECCRIGDQTECF